MLHSNSKPTIGRITQNSNPRKVTTTPTKTGQRLAWFSRWCGSYFLGLNCVYSPNQWKFAI